MSCEYEATQSRQGVLGPICLLTNRGCYADPDDKMGYQHCVRRTWACEYANKLQGALLTASQTLLKPPI